MDITNQGIAIGDLATAAGAAAAMDLYMGGGFRQFGSTLMEMGGGALIACQVADLLLPRAEDIWSKLYKSDKEISGMEVKLMRGLTAAAAMGGMLVLARGSSITSSRTLIPAGIAGGACVAGHMVSEWYIKMATAKKAKGAGQ